MESLRRASGLLQDHERQDRFPDLYHLVKAQLARRGSAGSESSSPWNFLRKEAFLPFPDFIYQQYDALECKSFMGLFPEINRAWVSIDNRLYLWNYEEVSEALSINTFDDQEQIIVSVGLTKPVPGVFLAEIEYVIVVTTPIDIILLGVAFEKPLKTPGEPRGKLTLYRTDLSIASDQVNMISVAGTDQGRVFMVGNDGNLHELQYQPEEGWFTRKIRKLNHSSSSLARLIVPPFLKWVTEGGISLQNLATCISNSNSTIPLENLKSLVVDNTRSCLYTLSKENHISLIYLGQDGRDYVKIAKQTGIYQKASRFTDQYSQFVPDERNFEIVSLHPVSPSESQVVQLMAVTSTGHRLYFSHFSDLNRLPLNGKLVAPAGLVLAFVRPPLGPVTSFGYGASLDGPRGAQIHQAFYSSGLFLAANSFTEEMDRLLGITLDSGAVSQVPNSKYLIDQTSFIDLKGKAWDIVEAPSAFSLKALEATEAGPMLNELSTQFSFLPRSFRFLSNEGVTMLTKLRPLDILFHLINQSQDMRVFTEFFDRSGRDQACAMSLAIACSHPSINYSKRGSVMPQVTPAVVNMATKLYFELGGKPTTGQGASGRAGIGAHENGGLLGIPLTTFEIRHSAKHNGLALYIARLVRPIWSERIVKTGLKNKLAANIAVTSLVTVQSQLQALDQFLDHYKGFTASPTPDNRPTGVDADAWRTEQESLAALHQLVRYGIEAISFLTLMIDYRFPNIIASMSEDNVTAIKTLTLESLITTQEGRTVGKALMTALVNHQIRDEMGVDAISQILHQRCPSICEPDDVILYKGMELLQSVTGVTNSDQREKILVEAQDLFASVIKHISVEKLRDITESYKSLRFYVGVVDLALLRASLEDVSTLMTENSDYRAPPYFKRLECYNLIFDLLAHLNELAEDRGLGSPSKSVSGSSVAKTQVIRQALASTDDLFHSALYTWFIEQGYVDELLHLNSNFLETFLVNQKDNIDMANLLWRYYVIHGRFKEAALVLSELADVPGLDLGKRVEYLTMAVSNAKSASTTDYTTASSILESLTDSLDVARIQMEVFNHVSTLDGYEAAAEDLNARLYDVNELYHKYARPLKMHEIILLILHTSNLGVQGRPLIESSWNEIIKNTIDEANAANRSVFDALKDKVRDIGLRYYPDENVFPLKFLIAKLEKESYEFSLKGMASGRGWLLKTLVGIKVPYNAIFSVLHDLFETKLSPWSSNKALTFLIEDIYVLLREWIEAGQQSSRGLYQQSDFPARFVDEAISKYLVTISSDAKQLSASLHQIQAKVRQRF